MKSILVTGSNGLLGQKLTAQILAESNINLIATALGKNRFATEQGYNYEEMDVLNPAQVKAVIEKYKPDAIIHTAAMTNVDTCHEKMELAYQLNVTAVETLLSFCI
jgi:dTDP-4-dehydrorhamnose reductase